MKRIVLMVSVMVFMASLVFGASKTLNATWQQTLPSPNDLAGWKLSKSATQGGPYVLEKTINYIAPQTTYSDTLPITVPDNAVTTLYFVLTAFDTSGNESGYSNEALVRIDFEKPSVPFTFTIIVATP